MAIAIAEAGKERLEQYERESKWDEENEEWVLPTLKAAGPGGEGQLRKKPAAGTSAGQPDGPPTNIGDMDPNGFANQFANDILGDSDDDSIPSQNEGGEDPFAGLDAQANSGGAGAAGRKSRNQEFREPAAGGYFNEEQADRRRGEAAKRVMNEASALRCVSSFSAHSKATAYGCLLNTGNVGLQC